MIEEKVFTTGRFRLDEVVVNPADNTLLRNRRSKRIEPKLMAVLCQLADRSREVVLREELKATVWQGLVVGDDAVNRAVFSLRNALGDDAKAPKFIETIPKRGYRLCCDVEWLTDTQPASSEPATLPAEPSATIMPELRDYQPSRYTQPSDDLKPDEPTSDKAKRLINVTRWLAAAVLLVTVVAGITWLTTQITASRKVNTPGLIAPVTHIDGSERAISFNPKSDDFAYIHDIGERADIFIYDQSSAQHHRVTDDYEVPLTPVWIDSDTLLYVSCSGWNCAIYNRKTSAKAQAIYSPGHRIYGLAADPQAPTFTYFSEQVDKNQYGLKRLNIETGEVADLNEQFPTLPLNIHPLRLDAANNQLYLSSRDGAKYSVLAFNTVSGEIQVLATGFEVIDGLDLMSSDYLIIAGHYSATNGLWLIPSDGGEPALFLRSSGAENIVSVTTHSASDEVFYGTHQSNLDIKFFSADSDKVDHLPNLNSDMEDDDPIFSFDGQTAYFISNRSGPKEVWQYTFATGQVRKVTHLNAHVIGRMALDESGRFLFLLYEQEQSQMAIISTSSGRVLVEKAVEQAHYPLAWSYDGQSVYASVYSDGFRIVKYSADTLTQLAVFPDGWFAAAESDQGESLVIPMVGHSHLQRFSPSGEKLSTASAQIDNFHELGIGQIVMTDKEALTLGIENERRWVVRHPYDSDDSEITLHLPRWIWVADIRRDGKAIFFEQHNVPKGAIMKAVIAH